MPEKILMSFLSIAGATETEDYGCRSRGSTVSEARRQNSERRWAAIMPSLYPLRFAASKAHRGPAPRIGSREALQRDDPTWER